MEHYIHEITYLVYFNKTICSPKSNVKTRNLGKQVKLASFTRLPMNFKNAIVASVAVSVRSVEAWTIDTVGLCSTLPTFNSCS